MTPFSLNPESNITGTHKIGQITLPPYRLVDRFGPPDDADGYKVSGEYRFQDAHGRVYTLYDWKETTLFTDALEKAEDSGLPTPEEFWANEDPTTLQIGGRDDSDDEAFRAWLSNELA